MKPYVVCHMVSSLDGRIKGTNWHLPAASKYFEETAAKIKADAWLVGRTTMQHFASKKPYRRRAGRFEVPKTDFIGKHNNKTYAVVIDPSGKCHWETNSVTTEHVIEVLTKKVSSEYLDHLRSKQVSYIFGGDSSINLNLVLKKLHRLFAIKLVRIDGGGYVNGSFLKAGLIDEFSLVLAPLVDGTTGSLALFEVETGYSRRKADKFVLKSVKRVFKNFLWMRYRAVKR